MKSFSILKTIIVVLILLQVFTSCSKDDDPVLEEIPTEFDADNEWIEGEISAGEILWYKVKGEEAFNTLYVEWAEKDYQGENKGYTADIVVSAYKLDGITPYFEDKDNGYGTKAKSFALDTEKSVLLKVEVNTEVSASGTFALKSTGTSSVELEYVDLEIKDEWTIDTISADETIGYKVKFSTEKKVAIIWAELGSEEPGYTAEIQGSVFQTDGETPYKDAEKGKELVNKNNSRSSDPKTIELITDENNFKIHISLNGAPGTYAIKVVEL